MTGLTFAPAVRHEAKARVAIIGPTGAGKTWTALEWASILGDSIAVIDTENGSASLYSDQYKFDTATWWPPYSATRLVAAIQEAAKVYDVVVLDSLTHFWQGEGGVLDQVDAAAQRAKGNQFAGWKEGSPIWRALLDALIFAPCHIIVTMRSKMDYVQTEVDGKKKVEKIGMQPVARNDVEYEFQVVGDMDQQHKMVVTKSRCSALADAVALPHQAGKLAHVLKDWLSSADAAPVAPPATPEPPVDAPNPEMTKKVHAGFVEAGIKGDDRHRFMSAAVGRPIDSWSHCTKSEGSRVIDAVSKVNAGTLILTVELDGTFRLTEVAA